MAINYTTLFTDIGAIINGVDRMRVIATDADTTGQNLGGDLQEHFNRVADNASSRAGDIAQLVNERLLDRVTVVDELLSVDSASVEEIVQELIRDMDANAQTVKASNGSLTSLVADGRNTGDGSISSTTVLDGYSPPASGYPPNLLYKSELSELFTPTASVVFTCIRDVDSGTAAGEEVFRAEGGIAGDSPFDWKHEGSGEVVEIATDNADNTLANRNWDSWNDDNTAPSWTATTGVAGTDFLPDYDASNVFRGVASLKLQNGDVLLEQPLLRNFLRPNRQYCMGFTWKAAAANGGEVKLEIVSPSTGFVSTAVSVPFASSTTSAFTRYTALVMMPANIPDDLVFQLSKTGTSGEVWIDSMSFAPVNYIGGIGYNIFAGADNFSVADRFTVVHDNTEGIFQRFFRRWFNVQLPSDNSPAISDSLAE